MNLFENICTGIKKQLCSVEYYTTGFESNTRIHVAPKLKLPFRSQLINFNNNKYFKELTYIYYNKCFLWRNLC